MLELRRRNVIRAGIGYVVGAWFVLQIADVFLTIFDVPNWLMQVLIIVLALGLPTALVFSWFFEITATGIKRTEDVLPGDSGSRFFDRRVDLVIIGILVAGLVLSLYGNFRGADASPELVSILIADFDNETGTDLFSGVLEESLRVGLEVVPFVDAFSRKVATSIAAGLPGADADTGALTLEAASLVALRRGINIVIGGSIRRTSDGLTITVSGVAPADHKELFTVTETAHSDAEILTTIAAIARKLRLQLGDTAKPGGAGENESFSVANLEAAAEYLKAQDLQLDRKLEEAVIHYEKALDFDPDFARAYAGLALTEQYLGRSEAATGHWKKALSRLSTLTERGRLRTLGSYYMINQRDYEKALETYESLVDRYPADNVARNNLAVTAFYAMDFGRALEVGRDVADRFPDHSGYGANLALYAMYASRFEEASAVAHNVIENDPRSSYAFLVLALTHAVATDFEAAADTYRRMTELDQYGRSIATEGLADLAIYRGDLDAAIDILADAIEKEFAQGINHSAALKLVMQADVQLQVGKREEARRAIDKALEYAGGDPAILVPAAIALTEFGETDRAETIAADMLKSFSKSQRAYANAIYAQVEHVRGNPTVAIEFANAAIESADLWLIRFIRAKIYSQAGFATEAAADLQECQARVGEGIAVFLNDRPSLRMLRYLDLAME